MDLHSRLSELATTHMADSPEGRAFLLYQLAEAEGGGGGELMIFDHLLKYVDDEKLAKLITIHKEDEERHEAMYLEAADRQGVEILKRPVEMSLLHRLDRKLGFFNEDVTEDIQVMKAYVLLQVIEERATTQFGQLRRVFTKVGDPATARMIGGIEADEARHLKYCVAIAKRYAPDEQTRLETLAEYRRLEAEAFFEDGRATLAFALEHGIIRSPLRRLFWSALQAIGRLRTTAPEAHLQLSTVPA